MATTEQPDETVDGVARQERAAHASHTFVALDAFAAQREKALIDELVKRYRNAFHTSAPLTGEQAWPLIGAISELRHIVTNARSTANAAAGEAERTRRAG